MNLPNLTLLPFRARAVAALALLVTAFALGGCRYRPNGTAYVFEIKSDREFAAWRLLPPEDAANKNAVRLLYYDRNSYLTYDPLPPGVYYLAVRFGVGQHYRIPVSVNPKQWYYSIPDPSADQEQGHAAAAPTAAVRVRGMLSLPRNEMPTQVFVVFQGTEVHIRRAFVENGSFATDAPGTGRYKVEVIIPGVPPKSWTSTLLDITPDTDLGPLVPR